jgi:hypothetical protein
VIDAELNKEDHVRSSAIAIERGLPNQIKLVVKVKIKRVNRLLPPAK